MADVASQNLLCVMKRPCFDIPAQNTSQDCVVSGCGGHTLQTYAPSGGDVRLRKESVLNPLRRKVSIRARTSSIRLTEVHRFLKGTGCTSGSGRARFKRFLARHVRDCFYASLVSLALLATPLHAQEDEDGVVRYAPGATGDITADLVEMMRRAKKDSKALEERLSIQGQMSLPPIDQRALRDKALSDPRVRALLGADGGTQPQEEQKWQHAQAFMFASFSMNPSLLRDMMEDAARFDIPVVFRGFHKNSVFETQNALLEVFGTLEEIKGFSIDPTLFTHFSIEAVPSLVLLPKPYEMCAMCHHPMTSFEGVSM